MMGILECSSATYVLVIVILLLVLFELIYIYWKMNNKVNNMYFMINSIKNDIMKNDMTMSEMIKDFLNLKSNSANNGNNDNKEINISPEHFIYHPKSPSSLIEVSDDDIDDDMTYESDDTYNDNINYNSEIKNFYMSLDLNNLEDINVLLLDEVATAKEELPLVEEQMPLVEEQLPSVEEQLPLVEEQMPLVEEQLPLVEEQLSSMEEQKDTNLTFKPKKRESRKNVGENKDDYKKMNLTDLRKYVVENNINIDASKMKKPEILRAMEELKKTEIIEDDSKNDEIKENDLLVE